MLSFFYCIDKREIYLSLDFLIEYSRFTMFQVYSKVIQLYIYILYIYILFQIIFLYRLLQNNEYSCLYY